MDRLHYAELDASLPEAKRRVVVTVMKVLEDESGRFEGVIRVGLLASRLEEVTRLRVEAKEAEGCPRFLESPLAGDWNGIHVSHEK